MTSLENSHWSQSFQNDPPQWRHLSCLESKLQKSFLGSEAGRAHKEKQHCSCDASSYLGIFCENSTCKGNATVAWTLEHPLWQGGARSALLPLSPLHGRLPSLCSSSDPCPNLGTAHEPLHLHVCQHPGSPLPSFLVPNSNLFLWIFLAL